jgi:hypothetical protein
MKAIYTKYLGPTNTKGARIKAFTQGGFSVSIPCPRELDNEARHFEAVKALVTKHKLDWNIRDMRFGDAPSGYVFCFAESVVQS